MAVEAGPRSAFELTVAVAQSTVDDPVHAVEWATTKAVAAQLVVSETVRVVEDHLADGCWYFLVTLRVFPRGAS